MVEVAADVEGFADQQQGVDSAGGGAGAAAHGDPAAERVVPGAGSRGVPHDQAVDVVVVPVAVPLYPDDLAGQVAGNTRGVERRGEMAGSSAAPALAGQPAPNIGVTGARSMN
jgi:hypothetical protein